MFIGREKELSILQRDFTGRAVMVYGKRRVGKTTLIQKAFEGSGNSVIYYECVRGSVQDNIDGFSQELVRTGILPMAFGFKSFPDIFSYLNTLQQRFVIIIDEYPYLKAFYESKTIDSIFQTIIDQKLSNIALILSGSNVGMMTELLEEANALYGRFATVLKLEELNYLETSAFYSEKSPYEKVGFYAVFGGSPFVNAALNPDQNLEENIIKTILNSTSAVHMYASQLLLSDCSVRVNAERILAALGNGRKRYSELENILDMRKTGNLAKQLNTLIGMDVLLRSNPINKLRDSKKATYQMNDNLLRFYYSYVYKNASALQVLGAEAFYRVYIEPTIGSFIAHRFEEICRSYFALQVQLGKQKGIRNIGTFYYDDAKNHRNGEFDVALEYADGFDVYEVKYLKNPMTIDEIHREIGQIRKMEGISVRQIGFISVNGFEEKEEPYLYLDGEELYGV